MMDILDRLQYIDGCVRVYLDSGDVLIGNPDCVVYDEDEDGEETVKRIRFEIEGEKYPIYLGENDIKGYEVIE